MAQIISFFILINGILFSYFLLYKKLVDSAPFVTLICIFVGLACVVFFHETIQSIKFGSVEISRIENKVEALEKDNKAMMAILKDLQGARENKDKDQVLAKFRNLINDPLSTRVVTGDCNVEASDKNTRVILESTDKAKGANVLIKLIEASEWESGSFIEFENLSETGLRVLVSSEDLESISRTSRDAYIWKGDGVFRFTTDGKNNWDVRE